MWSRLKLLFFLPFLFASFFSSAQARNPGGGGRSSGRTLPAPTTAGNTSANAGVPLTMADQEGKIEFRSESILVQVPVVVTDKSGNHIKGLAKTDFHITENGKEQSVSTFEELTAATSKLPASASKPGEFSNLTLSDQQPRTVTIIALDTINTPFLDQTRGRRELVKYLANSLDSGQVLALMIMTSQGLRVVQGITGDSAHLVDVVKKVTGELSAMQDIDPDAQADAVTGDIPSGFTFTPMGGDPTTTLENFVEHGDAVYAQFRQENAIEDTLNSFLAISWSLSGVPGRKSLIWATGGFPFTIGSPATVPGGTLSTLYERTMAALTQAQISVYPVDVRGLVDNGMVDASRRNMPTVRQMNNRAWAQQSTLDSLNEFAEMTGGKAFYNTNDLAGSFKRAADDASSYYMLGYYLDTKNNHAGWRSIKVKVDKKDVDVRARKGFFVTNATIHNELTRNSDLSNAVLSPIDGTGVPITMKFSGVTADGDKKKAGFAVRMPPNAMSIESTNGQPQINFDFAAVAFANGSKSSRPASSSGKSFTGPLSDAQVALMRTSGLGFNGTFELAPGQYTVRVVVRDNVTGKIGSVTAPLTVN